MKSVFIKLSITLLTILTILSIFCCNSVNAVDPPLESDSGDDTEKEERDYSFFCKTRYGHFVDDSEQKRRDACQDGFEGKGCDDKEEKDDIKQACFIGKDAPKINETKLSQAEIEKKSPPAPPDIRTKTPSGQKMCGSAKTAFVECPATTGSGIESSSLWGFLQALLNILLGLFTLAAVISLIWGGIVYSSSESDSSRLQSAKKIIKGVVIATIIYAAMYSILQFLIPGGIFK